MPRLAHRLDHRRVVKTHSCKMALGLLAAATLVLAVMSEILTDALEPATKQLRINEVFAGIILLASVSNISGVMNAVVLRFAGTVLMLWIVRTERAAQ